MSVNVQLPPEALEALVKGALVVLERLPAWIEAVQNSSLSAERKAALLSALDAAQARVAAVEVR